MNRMTISNRNTVSTIAARTKRPGVSTRLASVITGLALVMTGSLIATPAFAEDTSVEDTSVENTAEVMPVNAAEGQVVEPAPETQVAAATSTPTAANSSEYDGLRFYDVDITKTRHAYTGCIPIAGNPNPCPGGGYKLETYPNQFAKPIYWMAQAGLTTGTQALTPFNLPVRMYYPGQSLSREAMAAFLYRKAGKPSFQMPTRGFTDVKPGQNFYREIMWMKATGLSTGYADGSYKPKNTLSRQAMAAFMFRQHGNPSFTSRGGFTDTQGNQFAHEIAWMKQSGITTGYADGAFRPYDSVSREAMAAFMYRDAGSPWMPTIPPELVLNASGGNCSDGATFRRSLGWTYQTALDWARSHGCRV